MPPKVEHRVLESASEDEAAHEKILSAWVEHNKEPREESDRRYAVLTILSEVCRDWVRHTYHTEFNTPLTEDVGCKIFTTGSYRYNAHPSGSDIDCVLICPERMTLERFVNSLPEWFRRRKEVEDINVIKDAAVPLIAMKIRGIDIDLSFGAIRRRRVPEDINMLDDRILEGVDEKSMRGVNAVRVAQLLIDSVQDKQVFRSALRFVKTWAKAREIYSFKLGYPSGIGWAILTANICRRYPKKNGAGTVFAFFACYRTWFSPNPTLQRANPPVFLTDTLVPAAAVHGVGQSWNPRISNRDAGDLFPVLTPAYPYMNSCTSVSRTTLATLCDEFARGHSLISQLAHSTAAGAASVAADAEAALRELEAADGTAVATGRRVSFGPLWDQLFEKYNVFDHFTHFLHIVAACTDPLEYEPWVDFVESRLTGLWREFRNNRGANLDCFPAVRLRVIARRFENPELKDQLAGAKVARRQFLADWERRAGGIPPPPATAAEPFATHFYFGLAIADNAQSSDVDMATVIRTFQNNIPVRGPHTLHPAVNIVKRADVPEWVTPLPTAPPAQPPAAPATTTAVTGSDAASAAPRPQAVLVGAAPPTVVAAPVLVMPQMGMPAAAVAAGVVPVSVPELTAPVAPPAPAAPLKLIPRARPRPAPTADALLEVDF